MLIMSKSGKPAMKHSESPLWVDGRRARWPPVATAVRSLGGFPEQPQESLSRVLDVLGIGDAHHFTQDLGLIRAPGSGSALQTRQESGRRRGGADSHDGSECGVRRLHRLQSVRYRVWQQATHLSS